MELRDTQAVTHHHLFWLLLVALLAMLLTPEAFASQGTGGGLPFEGGLTQLRNSFTGPVAFTLSLLGIVVAGGYLIFGGELSGFARSLLMLVLVIGILVSAQNMMAGFFGRGAEIAQFLPEPMEWGRA